MPRGKPKANKDKGVTGAGGGPSSGGLDSRTRKRRAESQLNSQQPTFNAIQVTQVPPTVVEEHQQAATNTGIGNPTTSASTWQGTPEMPQLLGSTMQIAQANYHDFCGIARFYAVKNTNPDIPIGIAKIPRNPDSQKIEPVLRQ
uniref:Uncharacterized protein n=1 Tax=Magallana gigas TaxID=29159 RepID=K1RH09_MAGGI